jgi:hypothetical protein
MPRLRRLSKSFIVLRKKLLSIFNNDTVKCTNEINKKIIDRYSSVLSYVDLNTENTEILVSEMSESDKQSINLIEKKLGTTYKHLYIIEVVLYLKDIQGK